MPIDPYCVDSVCRERRVAVEVDGGTCSTEEKVVRDTSRWQRLGLSPVPRPGFTPRSHTADKA
jgi:very-short-patch-repair endonuclease